jgi:hypothetical protein
MRKGVERKKMPSRRSPSRWGLLSNEKKTAKFSHITDYLTIIKNYENFPKFIQRILALFALVSQLPVFISD